MSEKQADLLISRLMAEWVTQLPNGDYALHLDGDDWREFCSEATEEISAALRTHAREVSEPLAKALDNLLAALDEMFTVGGRVVDPARPETWPKPGGTVQVHRPREEINAARAALAAWRKEVEE